MENGDGNGDGDGDADGDGDGDADGDGDGDGDADRDGIAHTRLGGNFYHMRHSSCISTYSHSQLCHRIGRRFSVDVCLLHA